MKIIVGSMNQVKVGAVRELVAEYAVFAGAVVEGIDVESNVRHQPMTLEETIRGARHRAEQAYENGADYGVGIEGGLTPVPYTKTTYMHIGAVSLYDGESHHLGLTSGFEQPMSVMRAVIDDGMDMSEAYKATKLSEADHLGSQEGAIGLLTSNRVDRKAYVKQALMCAFSHIENKHLFDR